MTPSVPAIAAIRPTTLFTRPSLIDGQRAAVEVLVVECLSGGLGFLVTAHLNKGIALRAAGVTVGNHLDRFDAAMRLEQPLQITVGYCVRQVADIQLLTHGGSPENRHMRQ